MAFRIERVKLDGVKRTPQGGLRADAALTRSGIFVYRKEDGSEIKEYRPPEEVFDAESLSTLADAPVTNLHPPELVTTENFSRYAKGHVGEAVKQDDDKVVARMTMQDADLVAAVERGDMREVSCGYQCTVEETPGVTPTGERYDRVQRNIRYNHAAIVPMGRAGSEVRLRLDAADNVIPEAYRLDGASMTHEMIDGVKYEVGTEPHKAACARRDEAEKTRRDASDKLQARADSAEGRAKDLETKLAEANDPKRLDTIVAARFEMLKGARAVLGGEAKLDGKSEREIKLAVAVKANPSLKLDGKSDAYIDGLFDSALSRVEMDAIGELNERADEVTEDDDRRIDADAEWERMVVRNRNRWKQKPAIAAAE